MSDFWVKYTPDDFLKEVIHWEPEIQAAYRIMCDVCMKDGSFGKDLKKAFPFYPEWFYTAAGQLVEVKFILEGGRYTHKRATAEWQRSVDAREKMSNGGRSRRKGDESTFKAPSKVAYKVASKGVESPLEGASKVAYKVASTDKIRLDKNTHNILPSRVSSEDSPLSDFAQDANDIMDWFNTKIPERPNPYKALDVNGNLTTFGTLIAYWLRKGYTKKQLCQGALAKIRQWKDDKEMSRNLRPQTIFSREKFEGYLSEYVPPKKSDSFDVNDYTGY